VNFRCFWFVCVFVFFYPFCAVGDVCFYFFQFFVCDAVCFFAEADEAEVFAFGSASGVLCVSADDCLFFFCDAEGDADGFSGFWFCGFVCAACVCHGCVSVVVLMCI